MDSSIFCSPVRLGSKPSPKNLVPPLHLPLPPMSDSHDTESEGVEHDLPEMTALLLLFILTGLIFAHLLEIAIHRYHIYSIPGSGAVMVVGIITGMIVNCMDEGAEAGWKDQLRELITEPPMHIGHRRLGRRSEEPTANRYLSLVLISNLLWTRFARSTTNNLHFVASLLALTQSLTSTSLP